MDLEQAGMQRAGRWITYSPRARQPAVRLSSVDADAVVRAIHTDAL